MTTLTTTAPPIQPSRLKLFGGYLRRNKSLGYGLGILLFCDFFVQNYLLHLTTK